MADRGDEFDQCADADERTLSGPSANLQEFAAEPILGKPFRFHTVACSDIQHFDILTFPLQFLTKRNGREQVTPGTTTCYDHPHRTAGRRDSASSAPSPLAPSP